MLELAFAVAQCPPDCIAVMRPKGSAFGLPVIGRCAAKYAELYPDNGPFEVRYMPRELFHCYHCGSDHE